MTGGRWGESGPASVRTSSASLRSRALMRKWGSVTPLPRYAEMHQPLGWSSRSAGGRLEAVVRDLPFAVRVVVVQVPPGLMPHVHRPLVVGQRRLPHVHVVEAREPRDADAVPRHRVARREAV